DGLGRIFLGDVEAAVAVVLVPFLLFLLLLLRLQGLGLLGARGRGLLLLFLFQGSGLALLLRGCRVGDGNDGFGLSWPAPRDAASSSKRVGGRKARGQAGRPDEKPDEQQ